MPETPEFILSLITWDKRELADQYYRTVQHYKEKSETAKTLSEYANAMGIQNMYVHKIVDLISYSKGFGEGLKRERQLRETEDEPSEPDDHFSRERVAID